MTEAMWIATISGVLALAGSLVGVWLGGWNARKQQQAVFDQQERTRFHEQRFVAYADYVAAVERVFSGILVDGRQDVEDGATMQRAFGKARLVATTGVHAKLSAVAAVITRILPPNGEAITQATLTEYATAMRALISAARAELGVADPADDDAAFAAVRKAFFPQQPPPG